MTRVLGLSVLIVLLVLVSAAAPADEVVLKNGKKYVGDIVKDSTEQVIINTPGGTMTFSRSDVAQVLWRTDPRKLYKQKNEALTTKAVTARMELARWCLAQGLDDEARNELERVLVVEAQNFDAQTMLAKLVKPVGPAVPLRVEVTLTDGSQVKGRLINTLVTLETPYGVLRIPIGNVTGVTIGEEKKPDSIETQSFKARGVLAEELFVVDSKLGRLTIAKKDIRELAITQPTAAELSEIEFTDAMRQYNYIGLDVVLVVNATDSMTGVLLRLRQESKQLCDTVRRHVPNTQFGLVSYRDRKENDPAEFSYATQLTALAEKSDEFLKSVAALRAAGGGDIPDAVYDGLEEAMIHAGWRPKSHRVIILIGDSPPHPENGGVKKTVGLVGDWHKNTQGVLHAVDTTGYNRLMDEFKAMAEAGGGAAVALNDEKQVVRELIPLILGTNWRDRFLKAYDEDNKPAPGEEGVIKE